MSEQFIESTGEIVLASSNGIREEIAQLSQGRPAMYSSVKATDFASRKRVINALTDSAPIAENLNKSLKVVDIIVQAIEMENEQTHQLQTVPRIVLLTEDGKAYHAISVGLYRSVQNVLAIMGEPSTWPESVAVVVSKEGKGTSQYFTAKIA